MYRPIQFVLVRKSLLCTLSYNNGYKLPFYPESPGRILSHVQSDVTGGLDRGDKPNSGADPGDAMMPFWSPVIAALAVNATATKLEPNDDEEQHAE